MGYDATYEGDISYPREKEAEILQALKDLNHHHELKRATRNPKSGDPYQDHWFAGMDRRYHETVTSVMDVLVMLGFEVMDLTEEGDIHYHLFFDGSTGDEEHFLRVLAEQGALFELEYQGEDEEDKLLFIANDGKLIVKVGKVVWT